MTENYASDYFGGEPGTGHRFLTQVWGGSQIIKILELGGYARGIYALNRRGHIWFRNGGGGGASKNISRTTLIKWF